MCVAFLCVQRSTNVHRRLAQIQCGSYVSHLLQRYFSFYIFYICIYTYVIHVRVYVCLYMLKYIKQSGARDWYFRSLKVGEIRNRYAPCSSQRVRVMCGECEVHVRAPPKAPFYIIFSNKHMR